MHEVYNRDFAVLVFFPTWAYSKTIVVCEYKRLYSLLAAKDVWGNVFRDRR